MDTCALSCKKEGAGAHHKEDFARLQRPAQVRAAVKHLVHRNVDREVRQGRAVRRRIVQSVEARVVMTRHKSPQKPIILLSKNQSRLAENRSTWEKRLRRLVGLLLSVPACLMAGLFSWWNSLNGLYDASSKWCFISFVMFVFCFVVSTLRITRPLVAVARTGFEICLRWLIRADSWLERVFPIQ